MSTRCQIGFYSKKPKDLENFDALIYRHSDGYPGKIEKDTYEIKEYGVLPDIIPYLNWFKKNRGFDIEYCSARLLQWLCNRYDGFINFDPKYWQHEKLSGILGYGICKDFHRDIEYFYAIYPHAVGVYEVTGHEDQKFNLIETIEF